MVKAEYGAIVLVARGSYTSKPRPALVVQNPRYRTGESVIVIPFASVRNTEIDTRLAVAPSELNGLDRPCFLEVDKISAVSIAYLGRQLGVLEPEVLSNATDLARNLISLT